MPSVVLEDSEDDEENLLADLSGDTSKIEDGRRIQHFGEQSTGSTERLRKDILAAEGELRSESLDGIETPIMSRTMTARASRIGKRSRSEIPVEHASSTQSGRVLKRARSARDGIMIDAGNTSLDEIVVSARKTSRSKPLSILPTTSMQQSFMDNDPNLMFGNSDDTVAYTEQTQLLLNEMVPQRAVQVSNSDIASRPHDGHSDPRESSFPWTHDSANSTRHTQLGPDDRLAAGNFFQAFIDKTAILPSQNSLPTEAHDLIEQYLDFNQTGASPDPLNDPLAATQDNHKRTQALDRQLAGRSAVIQGSQDELALTADSEHQPIQSKRSITPPKDQAPGLGHSAPRDAAVIQSDDDNHANHDLERSKRATDGASQHGVLSTDLQASIGQEIIVQPLTRKRSRQNIKETTLEAQDKGISLETVVELLQNKPVVDHTTVAMHEPSKAVEPDVIFAMPTATARTKRTSAKTSKRSQTTIFEDCVDLKDRQETLTLAQQQAQRKASRQGSNSESKQQTKTRIRGKLVPGNEDAQNEKENEKAQEGEVVVNTPSQSDPAISIDESVIVSAKQIISDEVRQTPIQKEKITSPAPARPASPSPTDQQPTATTSQKETAPLSEKQNALKSSPTTHSPIKINTSVTFRVGLSKRQRIPSLLRVVRPAKQA